MTEPTEKPNEGGSYQRNGDGTLTKLASTGERECECQVDRTEVQNETVIPAPVQLNQNVPVIPAPGQVNQKVKAKE